MRVLICFDLLDASCRYPVASYHLSIIVDCVSYNGMTRAVTFLLPLALLFPHFHLFRRLTYAIVTTTNISVCADINTPTHTLNST